jgi:hypothetical protein
MKGQQMTVIQRWKEAKDSFNREFHRVQAERDEAREIIRQGCGQQPKKINLNIIDATIRDSFVELREKGMISSEIFPNPVEEHWGARLSEVEKAVEILKSATTGDFIAAWEKQQN